MKGLPQDDQLKGLVDEEDLFDFASLESATAALEADELGVEEFLAAVERLDEPEAALPSDSESESSGSLSEVMDSAERAAQRTDPPRSAPKRRAAPAAPAAGKEAPLPETVLVAAAPARMSPVLIATAAAVLVINAGISFVAWNSSQVAAKELASARERLDAAAGELVDGIDNEIDRLDRVRSPITGPPALATDGLAHIVETIARNDFDLARRQIYGVLALIDRVAESRRPDLEALASFLLGDIDRIEAAQLRSGAAQ